MRRRVVDASMSGGRGVTYHLLFDDGLASRALLEVVAAEFHRGRVQRRHAGTGVLLLLTRLADLRRANRTERLRRRQVDDLVALGIGTPARFTFRRRHSCGPNEAPRLRDVADR